MARVTNERVVVAVVALVLVGGLGGAVWAASLGAAPQRPAIDADVSDRYDDIDGLSANRTTTIERNSSVESRTTYSVRERPGTGERALALLDGPRRYDRRVSNGSVQWLYDADENVVTFLGGSGDPADRRGERLERLFARLNATAPDETPEGPTAVEPLPVVPRTGGSAPPVVGPLVVEYEGTEAVDGREAHVLRLTPREDGADAGYEQTVWVDTERFYPLRQRTAWTDDGERTVLTTTYRDVRFDPGLDDDAFEPDVPENATVKRPDTPETTTYRSVDALRAETNMSVPDPDLPSSFALTYATRTEGRIQGVGLRYANETSWVSVAAYNYTYERDDGDGVRVVVAGRNATLTRGVTDSLSWTCDDLRYTVRGRGLSESALVDVGRSVGCPADGG